MPKHRTGYLFQRGKAFYLRWTVEGEIFSKALRDTDGRPITTKREAEEARTKAMAVFTVADQASALESIAAKLGGRKAELVRLENEKNPPLPLATAWSEFQASPGRPDASPGTLATYEYQFGKFVHWVKEKHSEAAALRDITREIAEEYASSLNSSGVSGNTYNKHLNVLTMVFRVLKHKAKLLINPWEDIPRKRVINQSRRELTVDELKTICQSATGELRTLFAVGIYTGLREGDCATLRWAEVDLHRGIIRRIPNKTARRNPKPVLVFIHPVLRDILCQTPAEQRNGFVLPETADAYTHHRRELVRKIQDHFSSCGIQTHKTGTGGQTGNRPVVEVGFHSLRHTFVSLCRESNAPLAVVESIVGHSNPAMTRHYTHVGELAATKAVAALPFLMGEEKAATDRPTAVTETSLRSILGSMTEANWQSKRDELLALLPAVERTVLATRLL